MTLTPATSVDLRSNIIVGPTPAIGTFPAIGPLPRAAEDKLDLLRRQRADYFALLNPLHDEENALISERMDLNIQLGRRRATGFGEDRNAGTADLVERIEKLDVKLARVRNALAQRLQNKSSSVGLIQSIDDYLKMAQRKGPLTAFTGEVVVPKGDPSKVLSKTREAIAELKADRHKVRSSSYPSSVAKAHVKSIIDEMADRGRPSVAALLENVRHVEWKGASAVRWEFGNQIDGAVVAGAQLIAWLQRDALLAALYAEIDEMADDKNALSEEQRTAELARIEAQALEQERIEEVLVEDLGVDRRPDADPRAVLGLDGPAPTSEF